MFRSVGPKLTLLIGAAIAAGLIAVVGFYAYEQQKNILRQNERTIHKVTESVTQGLQTVMIAGYADVAELYAARLKGIPDVVDFRILRVNGVEAFKDNETIHRVNDIRGDEDFLPRNTEEKIQVVPADDPNLKTTVQTRHFTYYYGEKAGERTLTFLWPVTNDKECHKCHGKDHEVRGVVELTTSLKAVEEEVGQTWRQAGMILAGALSMIVVVTAFILRRSVVRPIKEVSNAMRRVSGGDLQQEVPVIGQDELAQMARSFNSMLGELRETYLGFRTEHNKLETIIHGSRDGIVVTNPAGEVVLVNPAAERLLGKSVQQVVEEGFERLLDEPERMHAMLAQAEGGAQILIYKERFLAVSAAAISSDDGRPIGRAALVRDITEEKRLEQMLRALSNTDGLTGLANRRLLNETLAREVERSLQFNRSMAILMFDVDHFKKFNDTYGHDQGDRVLKAVADVSRQCVRVVDLPCRYGGEEFLIILTETPLDGALIVAERLREAIETMRVDGLQVTISIGVAGRRETGAKTPEALIEAADAALYESKRGGRNRVTAARAAEAVAEAN